MDLLNEFEANIIEFESKDIKRILLKYITQTGLYDEFIGFIADISARHVTVLTNALVRTKATANALTIYNIDTEITKDNWFVWARYLLNTEDKEISPNLNMVVPANCLKRIRDLLTDKVRKKIEKDDNEEFKHLVVKMDELFAQYSRYMS